MSKHESYACKRLSEQIKFFGAKPKRFVSIYAKKPRIRLKVKSKSKPIGTVTEIDYNQSRHQYLEKLFLGQQREREIQSRIMADNISNVLARGGSRSLTSQAAHNAAMIQMTANQQALGLSSMTGMVGALGQAQAQGLGRSSISGMGAFLPQSLFW